MQTPVKPVLVSGIQPSGELNIGGYIGAIKSWQQMQQHYDCLFMLADLHTLTAKQDPHELRRRCYDVLALYIACGIDPDNHILFAQSQVPAHTQLAWVLNCYTYMGELNRMTQFKDKSQRNQANINAGLFSYPVLMAADILLYGAHQVLVGDDQKQHLELVRDLALRFNSQYGDIFTVPEPYIPQQGARIMSLLEPTQKMSKSDSNVNNTISLLDTSEVIRDKFKRAVTDSGNAVYSAADKPGVSNLLILLSSVTGITVAQLEQNYQGCGYGQFKSDVAEAVIAHLAPIQKRFHALRADDVALQVILKRGAEAAQARAAILLRKVYTAVGLI